MNRGHQGGFFVLTAAIRALRSMVLEQQLFPASARGLALMLASRKVKSPGLGQQAVLWLCREPSLGFFIHLGRLSQMSGWSAVLEDSEGQGRFLLPEKGSRENVRTS